MWMHELEYLLRILLAAMCGMLIGFERETRMKEAGIRTHMMVALGAALIMVVSKYGFFDLAAYGYSFIRVDASRVASQIVSGVGFLGAGIIMVRHKSVRGLTTAAGLWATAGVGMALGAGMYVVGGAGTLLMILIQIVLHHNFSFLHLVGSDVLEIEFGSEIHTLPLLSKTVENHGAQVTNLALTQNENNTITVTLQLQTNVRYAPAELLQELTQMDGVTAVRNNGT